MQILAQEPWQQTGESLAHCVSAEQMLGLAGVPRTSEQRSDMDASAFVCRSGRNAEKQARSGVLMTAVNDSGWRVGWSGKRGFARVSAH